MIGEITPDPDGAGSNPPLATRYNYNSRGVLHQVQQGTVADLSDAAWNAFGVTTQAWLGFDVHGRPVRQLTYGADGHAYQVSDTVYDSEGRRLARGR